MFYVTLNTHHGWNDAHPHFKFMRLGAQREFPPSFIVALFRTLAYCFLGEGQLVVSEIKE